jgi:hypothetical protein
MRSWRWDAAKQDGKAVRTSRIQKINLGVG